MILFHPRRDMPCFCLYQNLILCLLEDFPVLFRLAHFLIKFFPMFKFYLSFPFFSTVDGSSSVIKPSVCSYLSFMCIYQ